MREFVADVGNSRVKVGECGDDALARTAALLRGDLDAWEAQLKDWEVWTPASFTLAGSDPKIRDRLVELLRADGHTVRSVTDFRQLPLKVEVDHPEKVGIDRLLSAIAVLHRVGPGQPILVVNAGSAVTVDFIDSDGAFRGGAILPGYRLMAKSLNDYTAQLPFVESFDKVPPFPGLNTEAAIRSGIDHAIHGAVERMTFLAGPCRIFLAGGDAERLADLPGDPEVVGPYFTLDGLRLTAKYLA